MNSESFLGGFVCGLLAFVLILSGIFALWGHLTVETVKDIEVPTMYKVTVDDVEFMCKSEPETEKNYLVLWNCDSMPDTNMRVKRYLEFEFVEVPGE